MAIGPLDSKKMIFGRGFVEGVEVVLDFCFSRIFP